MLLNEDFCSGELSAHVFVRCIVFPFLVALGWRPLARETPAILAILRIVFVRRALPADCQQCELLNGFDPHYALGDRGHLVSLKSGPDLLLRDMVDRKQVLWLRNSWLLMGAFALAIVGYGTVAWRLKSLDFAPEISHRSDTSADTIAFSIRNRSGFLTLKNVRWLCAISYSAWLHLEAGHAPPPGTTGKISKMPPLGSAEVECPVHESALLGPRAELLVHYEILWTRSTFKSAQFKWSADSNPPKWVEDPLVSTSISWD
jgi:hypothetical protein